MEINLISIIIPVFNEESSIEEEISHLRQVSTLLPIEIIVVDGGSSDRTVEIGERTADHFISSPLKNRSAQMRLGAEAAKGELLIFLHADTRLPLDWQKAVINCFESKDQKIAAGAFKLKFNSDSSIYKLIAFLANCRTKITGVPQGDQALFVSSQVYKESGGFPQEPLMEEYLFIPNLRKLGSIKILNYTVITSIRRYVKNGPLRNSLRNSFLVLLFYLGVSPKRLATWYN
ncbi:MAG: TIGR04283 family arsenosugar biosynthesis glycosyltransferase [Elusimicrobia bacterium]|nr:TIGR04283 family arsenosugar biosynthesis glycosyltransferase [Elusimicrobiota bacterium]